MNDTDGRQGRGNERDFSVPESAASESGRAARASGPEPAVRRMRPDDADAVAHALTMAFAPATSASPPGPRPLITNRLAARWQARCAGAWVVDAPGFGPVGAAFAVVEPGAGWIGGLGVHPAYRGVGVGRALTTAALGFLDNSGCGVVGLEASPNDGAVLGAYARRGLRPVDVTLRLRADAAALATSGSAAELQVRPLPDPMGSDGPQAGGSGSSRTAPTSSVAAMGSDCRRAGEDQVARRAAAVPMSDATFMAFGPGMCVVCDPEARPAGTALEVRVGFLGRDGCSIASACRALGRVALAHGLRYVELDLPVGTGAALPALFQLGFQTVVSTLRLARPANAFRRESCGVLELGRWSL